MFFESKTKRSETGRVEASDIRDVTCIIVAKQKTKCVIEREYIIFGELDSIIIRTLPSLYLGCRIL